MMMAAPATGKAYSGIRDGVIIAVIHGTRNGALLCPYRGSHKCQR